MTIEVRQLLIKSQVNTGPQAQVEAQGQAPRRNDPDTERLRRELMAECKAWLAQKLQEQKER